MKLHDLQPAEGARKSKKRVGRGLGSGQGTYAGRGKNVEEVLPVWRRQRVQQQA